jgi:hypothetical protein
MDTSRDDIAECISDGHLQFMKDFILRDELKNKATLDRFLAARLKQRDKVSLKP